MIKFILTLFTLLTVQTVTASEEYYGGLQLYLFPQGANSHSVLDLKERDDFCKVLKYFKKNNTVIESDTVINIRKYPNKYKFVHSVVLAMDELSQNKGQAKYELYDKIPINDAFSAYMTIATAKNIRGDIFNKYKSYVLNKVYCSDSYGENVGANLGANLGDCFLYTYFTQGVLLGIDEQEIYTLIDILITKVITSELDSKMQMYFIADFLKKIGFNESFKFDSHARSFLKNLTSILSKHQMYDSIEHLREFWRKHNHEDIAQKADLIITTQLKEELSKYAEKQRFIKSLITRGLAP